MLSQQIKKNNLSAGRKEIEVKKDKFVMKKHVSLKSADYDSVLSVS